MQGNKSVVLKSIDKDCCQKSLWNKEMLQKFFDTCVPQRKLSAVTVRAYLQSIRHFYSYVSNVNDPRCLKMTCRALEA